MNSQKDLTKMTTDEASDLRSLTERVQQTALNLQIAQGAHNVAQHQLESRIATHTQFGVTR